MKDPKDCKPRGLKAGDKAFVLNEIEDGIKEVEIVGPCKDELGTGYEAKYLIKPTVGFSEDFNGVIHTCNIKLYVKLSEARKAYRELAIKTLQNLKELQSYHSKWITYLEHIIKHPRQIHPE